MPGVGSVEGGLLCWEHGAFETAFCSDRTQVARAAVIPWFEDGCLRLAQRHWGALWGLSLAEYARVQPAPSSLLALQHPL